ncbi:unnamed protein product [Coregonus sp. 'balchen']|nr:unnamed protein product [Coregonus sp. 'balchen']
MASRVPIESEAVLTCPSPVSLLCCPMVEKYYSSMIIQPNSPISSDLLLDQTECGQRPSAVGGLCRGQWLWSFDQQQQCLSIQSLSLYNISRGEETDIAVSVKGLPSLVEGEAYKCFYQDVESPATVTDTGVTCSTPDASRLPLIGQGEDSVTVPLSLRFLKVTVAAWEFTFFDCGVVQQLSGRMPCRGCVSSRWGCNWCIHQHFCTPNISCDEGVTIYNQHQPNDLILSWLLQHSQPQRYLLGPIPQLLPPTTPEPTAVPTTLSPTIATTTPSTILATQATTALEVTTSLQAGAIAGETTVEGDGDGSLSRTSGGTGETEKTTVTRVELLDWPKAPETVSPSSTTGLTDTGLTGMEPSFSDTTSTTSSGVPLLVDLPTGSDRDDIPMAPFEGTASPPWTKKWDKGEEETKMDPATSSATAPSGVDDPNQPSQSFTLTPDLESESSPDYQSDSFDLPDCPCVEKVEGSSLLPVNVERKITLVGLHLHLFQDDGLDYECVLTIEGRSVVVEAYVEPDDTQPSLYFITCQLHQYAYTAFAEEYNAMISVRRRDNFQIDSADDLHVTLFNCSVGRSDCSRCRTADQKYGCVWCGGARSRCSYQDSCTEEIKQSCPAPVIHFMEPVSGPVEGGTVVTISGSNLGQKAEDIQNSVTIAGVPCTVINSRYEISSRIVCETTASRGQKSGQASVEVRGGGLGFSDQRFSFQDPALMEIAPQKGPKAGGSALTIMGQSLKTGHPSEVSVLIGGVPCLISSEVVDDQITCMTGGSNRTGEHGITVRFGRAERHLEGANYYYTSDPNVTMATPSNSFLSGGRMIRVSGQNLDVVQEARIRVTLSPLESLSPRKRMRTRRSSRDGESRVRCREIPLKRQRRIVPEPDCPEDTLCVVKQFETRCAVSSSSLILCPTPAVGTEACNAQVKVDFLLDNLHFDFSSVGSGAFSYALNPILIPLNQNDPSKPYHHKPGSIISVEGENLDLAIFKEEVVALIGEGVCSVKTLTHNHLYCEPPSQQPSVMASRKQEGMDSLPEFTVHMGNLNFSLGRVQYDTQVQSTFPLEAQVRKSKQAVRDYKKVQIQLENLETGVRDRCKKEFTDLMTEMMDCSSDLVGSGIPFLDYRAYAERIFFPGHRESPLRRDLDVPECRRQTVEQGLVQLSNLLNSKLFLTTFIHTLEVQRTFSPRDRAYVASLLTVALHGKLEYFTDILKTLLNDLVVQYVAKNPRLMLRRTESVVEKLLTNWMSMCLFTFLRDTAGESFYMLFRAIKHQVDKGPVDAVTGKAKYTLNDNRLLREDVEYKTLTLNVLMPAIGNGDVPQTAPAKVLDCDTITQVKEKLLEQAWKGMSFSQRPHTDTLHLEWRAGTAGHLILSDEDLTSVVQGSWKRLNTLQHYKVPDGATVALVPRNSKHDIDGLQGALSDHTPMLDDGDEGGVKLWHLVKANEEPDLPKHRRGSLRERERAKAIPEIYLTRLLSMKGTLQKFVDDLFTVILTTNQPVPMAVNLPLRFWINILKNPQFIFDVQASDHVDAVLSVIAQTFMDSCTIAEHKLGRDSPINKLLYARDIPRYKQMVERYYADIRQTISASDQEMNSALAELSRNYAGEVNYLVALHELYKYINKYYDQKMQLGYRLQQISAAVENKVTDL